ncbi:hypothetical protein FJZ39_03540 [Candidatus Saccharibacteria bacterium]|nr:hypothetical protein [Candidatus Saccharibacteria bacterium]
MPEHTLPRFFRHDADIITKNVHYFPGDEAISPARYESAIQGGYLSCVTFTYGAARSFGLPIDTETFERWKRITTATKKIDDYIDDDTQRYADVLAHADPSTSSLSSLLADANTTILDQPTYDNLALLEHSVSPYPEQYQQLFYSAAEVAKIGLAKRRAQSVDQYKILLEQEALATAPLLYNSVSSSVKDHSNYSKFTDWCQYALELGTLADSGQDLMRDKQEGLISFDVTACHALSIALSGRTAAHGMLKRRASLATARAVITRGVSGF